MCLICENDISDKLRFFHSIPYKENINNTLSTKIMNKELQNILISAIKDYNERGLYDVTFLSKAHKIYNEFAYFSCPLPLSDHPYLLGIVFSYFSEYYKNDIDTYTSIIENALFCFFRVIKENEFQMERQSAAIRLLLLIDRNDWVMKGITRKFYTKNCEVLFGMPFDLHQIFEYRGLGQWVVEGDILRILGHQCTLIADSNSSHVSISETDMRDYHKLLNENKYRGDWPLVKISTEQLFEMYDDFIRDFINTPYERRITQLIY